MLIKRKILVDVNQTRFHHLPIRSFYVEQSLLGHQAFFVISFFTTQNESFLSQLLIGDSIRILCKSDSIEKELFSGFISEIFFFKGSCRLVLSDSFFVCRQKQRFHLSYDHDFYHSFKPYLQSVGLDFHPLSANGWIHQDLVVDLKTTLEDLLLFYADIYHYFAFFIDPKTFIYLPKDPVQLKSMIMRSGLVMSQITRVVRFGSLNYIDFAFSKDLVLIVMDPDSEESFDLLEKVFVIDPLKRLHIAYLFKKEVEIGLVNQKKYVFKLLNSSTDKEEQDDQEKENLSIIQGI